MQTKLFLLLLFPALSFAQIEEEEMLPPTPPEEVSIEIPDVEKVHQDSVIYDVCEVGAEFPGGQAAVGKFMSRNIVYPQIAKDMNIQGRVYVRFIVEKDGSVTNVKIIKGVNKLLDEEAIRVVKLMPKWNPGKQGENTVRIRYTLPVTFRLN